MDLRGISRVASTPLFLLYVGKCVRVQCTANAWHHAVTSAPELERACCMYACAKQFAIF